MNMLLTHAQVITTINQIVTPEERDEISIFPDHSSSSEPPSGFDTPEYWTIFYHNNSVATLYNENYQHRIPRNIGNWFGKSPLPIAGAAFGLKRDNPKLYSALETLTNKRIYDNHTLNRVSLRALGVHV